MSAVAVPPRSPYKGLSAFDDTELDALLFFGREREQAVIVANLLASRLTVLYGQSGVGKSSILRAGVARELRRVAPQADVVVHDLWAGEPLGPLDEVDEEVETYVVLDQFEEYFLYHGDNGAGTLVDELPELLHRAGRVNVLIAIREDALSLLDAFTGRIPNVFANRLRLEHLDREGARAAIRGPLARWNELAGEKVEIEPALVEAVLDEVTAGKVDLGGAGAGAVEGAGREGRIEAPYLQLVLERIWDAERASASDTLRLETLTRLGGAEAIVRDHLQRALDALTPAEKDVAASMFEHLVTPSGMKIAQGSRDLADYAEVREPELMPVLAALNRERILRAVDGQPGAERYEIFHDVLTDPVLAWRHARSFERQKLAAERRHRRLLGVSAALLVGLAAMAFVAVYALAQRGQARDEARRARAGELAATALSVLDNDPHASLALALRAATLNPGVRAEAVLRRALITDRLRAVIQAHAPVRSVAYGLGGRRVVTGDADGRMTVWDARSRRRVASYRLDGPVSTVAADPDRGLILGAGGPAVLVAAASSGGVVGRFHERGTVTSAVFGRGGRVVLVGGSDGVELRTPAGALVRRFRGARSSKQAVLSPDGRLVACACGDKQGHVTPRVFDARTGRLLRALPQRGATDVRFSPDGKLLASSSMDGTTDLWAARSGRRVRVLDDGGGAVLGLDFNPDGSLLATAGVDAGVRVWETGTGARRFFLLGHTNPVLRVAFSPDGVALVSASRDRTARLWDIIGVEQGEQVGVLAGHSDTVDDAVFDPSGRSLATGSEDGTTRLWDARIEERLLPIARQRGAVNEAAFSTDGRLVVSGGAGATARISRARGGTVAILRHRGAVSSVAFAPDGRHVLTSSADGTAGVWTTRGREVLTLRHGAPLVRAVYSSDGSAVATAGTDGTARIWRSTDGAPLATLRHGAPLTDVALTRDAQLAVTVGADGVVRVWETRTRRVEYMLRGHEGPVVRIALSPGGRTLASAGADGTARLWSLSDGRLLHVLRGHTAGLTDIEFSADGSRVVTSGFDADARIWAVATGRRLRLLRGQSGRISAASFSRDGRWVVTAGPISAVLWPTDTGRLLFYLRGHTALLTSVSFSPDGSRVLSSSVDGSVRVYHCSVCGTLADLERLARLRLQHAGS